MTHQHRNSLFDDRLPTRTAHLSVMDSGQLNGQIFEGGENDEENRLPQVPRAQTEDIPPVTAQPEKSPELVEVEYRHATAHSPRVE